MVRSLTQMGTVVNMQAAGRWHSACAGILAPSLASISQIPGVLQIMGSMTSTSTAGVFPLHADHVIESIITELCVVCPVKRHPKNVSWDVMFILAISAISNGAAEKTSLRSQPAFSIDSHFSADLTLSKIHAEEVHADNFAQRTS
jgi:hypothetical protein